jgi:hypothetical protein
MRKASAYNQILGLLHQLNREYPQYNIGRHLATALDEYGDVWGMTDYEVLFAITKYKTRLNMDIQRDVESDDIQRIIQDGIDLDELFKEEEYGNS